MADTAKAHLAAWKETMDPLLADRGQAAVARADDLGGVDGVANPDSVRRFLAARGIEVPEGAEDDLRHDTLRGLCNLENRRFGAWLEDNPVPLFEDAVDLMRGLAGAGIRIGIVAASRNTRRLIEAAGLGETIDATIDGGEAQDLGLAIRPDPAQLVETARRLDAQPHETAVIEDTVAGVTAAAAGRFGLVIGVNRRQDDPGAQRHALRANGADLVTRDLRRLLLPGGGGLRTLDRLPLVWDRLEAFGAHLKGRRLSVFLDFDGTLSPIVDDYRAASIPDETRDAIRRLAGTCPVAIISGRDLADVRARVGIDDVIYAGSHGFDIAGPDGLQARPDAADAFLEPIAAADRDLRAAVAHIRGAMVERKTFSVAVHYREVAQGDVAALGEAVESVLARHDKLRKGRGKKVIEIQPRADWDKGRAVEWLLEHTHLGERAALPLYLGDDLTDEDAFAALGSRGVGISVRGGGRATLADHALADPDDVRRFLGWLSDLAESQR